MGKRYSEETGQIEYYDEKQDKQDKIECIALLISIIGLIVATVFGLIFLTP